MATNNPITGYIFRAASRTPTTALLLSTHVQFQTSSQAHTDTRIRNPYAFDTMASRDHHSSFRASSSNFHHHANQMPLLSQRGEVEMRRTDNNNARVSHSGQRQTEEGDATSRHTHCPVCRQQCRAVSNISHPNYRRQNSERQSIDEPGDLHSFVTPATDVGPPTTVFFGTGFVTPTEETQPGLECSELVCGRFSFRLSHSLVLNNN